MIRNLIRLLAVLAVAHALYHFLPPYLHYQQFKDDVKQTALFAGRAPESEIAERVMQHARARQVPVAPEQVSVRRVSNQTFIDVEYLQPLKLLPWYTYRWQVKVSESAIAFVGQRP